MKAVTIFLLMLLTSLSACSQNPENDSAPSSERIVGGRCVYCEAVLDYGKKNLTSVDTLPDFQDAGPKLLVSGTIYKHDGKTPAKNVILYIYHTDQTGKYPRKGNERGWAAQHGYIRGWIKTNADGKYMFYTMKPGAYPAGGNPAHIHPVIKEPGIQGYWIDEFLFEGDPYLTDNIRASQQGRGGKGIMKAKAGKNGMLLAERDIILGQNVPGY
jgi:protocatechuate 3,4-dioxygenase, beta subunit